VQRPREIALPYFSSIIDEIDETLSATNVLRYYVTLTGLEA
jgi:hypothetical protein